MTKILTQEIVRQLIDYNADTGMLTWKARSVELFNGNETTCKSWNRRYAGKHTGSIDKNGYILISILDKTYRAHRIIWLWMTGEWPDQVDHINGDRSDNRWCNLRSVNPANNMKNRGMNKNNTSGYKGVRWNKKDRKWHARIKCKINNESKQKHLGSFTTSEEAYAAYVTAAKEACFSDRHIFD